jgi:probable HAF family extracellular repeat protein
MRRALRSHGTALCATLLGLAACDDNPVQPTPRLLPTTAGPSFAIVTDVVPRRLGAGEARATAINDDGFVTGFSGSPGPFAAVIWSPTGATQVLDVSSVVGFPIAQDINNSRQVVGYAVSPAGHRAWLWSEVRGARELETLGGGAAAYRINDDGDVVGQSQIGHTSGPWRAVIWKAPDYKVQTLPMLSGECTSDYGVAWGVNDHRQVVGMSCSRAFVWSETEGIRALEALPGARQEFGWGAFAINNAGYVVGASTPTINGFPRERATLWNPSGVPRDLGALPGEVDHIFGPSSSVARDINDRGEVTGYSHYRDWRSAQLTHATLWADGEVKDLGTLPPNPQQPDADPRDATSESYSINKHGQVVGHSRNGCCGDMATIWGITYANSAPVANAGGPYSGYEGTPIPFTGTATDPDGDKLTFSWAFGDDGTSDKAIDTHVYADNGGFTAKLTATDPRGLSGTAEVGVSVHNVAPTVSIAGPPVTIYSGETFNLSASFSDPGTRDAPWDTMIDWGEGVGMIGSTRDQSAPITGSHQYFHAATYTVRVTVVDKDRDPGVGTLEVEVLRLPVSIDVEPRDRTNTILTGGPRLDVALLTTDGYDATLVQPASVVITNGSGSGTGLAATRRGLDYDHVDVNGDGRVDLLLSFRKLEMVLNGDLTLSTTKLILLAEGGDARQIRGEDAVTVRP